MEIARFLNFHTWLRQSNPLLANGLCPRGRYFQNTNAMQMITFVLLEGECHFIMVAKPSHKSRLFYWAGRDLLPGGLVTSEKKQMKKAIIFQNNFLKAPKQDHLLPNVHTIVLFYQSTQFLISLLVSVNSFLAFLVSSCKMLKVRCFYLYQVIPSLLISPLLFLLFSSCKMLKRKHTTGSSLSLFVVSSCLNSSSLILSHLFPSHSSSSSGISCLASSHLPSCPLTSSCPIYFVLLFPFPIPSHFFISWKVGFAQIFLFLGNVMSHIVSSCYARSCPSCLFLPNAQSTVFFLYR